VFANYDSSQGCNCCASKLAKMSVQAWVWHAAMWGGNVHILWREGGDVGFCFNMLFVGIFCRGERWASAKLGIYVSVVCLHSSQGCGCGVGYSSFFAQSVRDGLRVECPVLSVNALLGLFYGFKTVILSFVSTCSLLGYLPGVFQ
jgi:hypothetical protein